MFERLTSTVLQRSLQEYFVLDGSDANVMDVWSGYVRWNQMELRTAWLNEKIQAKGLPFQVLHGHVNLLTISIPWSKLSLLSGGGNKDRKRNQEDKNNGDAASIVVVLDGVQLLVRTRYDFDDDALDQARIKNRRKKLQRRGTTTSGADGKPAASSTTSWRQSLRQHVKDGILPKMADNLQLHIRDLHIRLEDIHSSPQRPMAMGLVLESLHLQHDEKARTDGAEPTWVSKGSQVNHFAIYANSLEESSPSAINGDSQHKSRRWSERSILQHCTQREVIVEVLDRSIPRRANSLETATTRMAPQHTYILGPVDATAQLQSGTDPSVLVAQNRPVLSAMVHVPTVTMALQDVHCHAGLAWYARYQDHKYRARYRTFRPRVAVASDPRAWWQYAATCIRYELQQSRLHWSWRRFQRRYQVRKRYCDLYERLLRAELALSDDDDDDDRPLSAEEAEELQAMDDGTRGDLALEDIFLYRAIVQKRLGKSTSQGRRATKKQSSLLKTKSWLQKAFLGMFEDDSAASDEFQRAMDLWEEAKQNASKALEESTSWVALSVEFVVDEGIITAYTPLQSTIDQSASRRLQARFLSLVFKKFRAHGRLLGDFQSMRLDTVLQDFRAEEDRIGQTRHTVIAREVLEHSSFLPEASPTPFLRFQFLKNSKETTDFHMGINAEMQQLVVTLEPNCEWIKNGRSLIRPLPRLTKLQEFWADVGMNFINAARTHGREIFAKAETAVADHKSIDVDIWIDCPVIRMFGADPSRSIVVDFGQARFRTERLAGVAKSKLISTLKNEAARLALAEELEGPAENSLEFLRANQAVNDSMRSGQLNDMIEGIHVFRDDMTALDNLADTPGDVMEDGIQSFFYDSYALDVKTGSLLVQNVEAKSNVVEPVVMRATILRSIIPRDSTLFRYKMLYSVGDVVLAFTENDVFCLREIFYDWFVAINAVDIGEKDNLDDSIHYGNVGLFLGRPLNQMGLLDDLEGTSDHSDFDEDEFFDTMEHESAFSDLESAVVGDNFMAESDSILGSDSLSLARSVRSRSRRKRQASISDVSSISEGSLNKRKGAQPDNPYLSAENLARLEENAEEDSVGELGETGDVDEESFQSAVSASHVLGVIRNLDDDIAEAKQSLNQVRDNLAELRALEKSRSNGDEAERRKLKRALQLEKERINAELMAMTATRDDLRSRVGVATSSAKSVTKDTNRSIEVASILLKNRKKRGTVGIEQSLSATRTRKTLQVSGTVDSVSLSYAFHGDEDDERSSCFWMRFANFSLVFVADTAEKKVFLSNESLSSGINRFDSSHHVFVGGSVEDYHADLLSSRIPHLLPPTSFEEKLLRVAISVVKAKPGMDPDQLVRVRVAVGDFQITPRPSYVHGLQAFFAEFKGDSGNVVDNFKDEGEVVHVKSVSKPFYFDTLVTLSSCKILDGNGGRVALVCSDITLRVSGARTDQLYRQRSQFDLRWGGFQVLYLSDFSNGQASELFYKRDAFNPFMRARMRVQKAALTDQPGWVIGQSLPLVGGSNGFSSTDDGEVVQNIHASVQIEAVNILVSPQILSLCITAKDEWTALKSPAKSPDKRGKQLKRVRLDLMTRKVSVLCGFSTEDILRDNSESKRVVLNAGFRTSWQVDTNSDVISRLNIDDASAIYSNESIPFLKPCSIVLMIDRSEAGSLVEHQKTPVMNPPDTYVWICEQNPSSHKSFPSKMMGDMNTLVTLLVAPCEMGVNPGMAAALIQLSRDMKASLKSHARVNVDGTRKETSKAVLRLNMESVRASFFEKKNTIIPGSVGPKFLLGIHGVMGAFEKEESGSLIWVQANEIESVDFSLRRGIKSLGRSTLKRKSGNSKDNSSSMIEVEATMRRENDKLDASLSLSLECFQVLVLPSLIGSMIGFRREFSAKMREHAQGNGSLQKGTPLLLAGNAADVHISIKVGVLEVLVPTKEVVRAVKESAAGDLGVVSVRCGLEFTSKFSADDLESILQLDTAENFEYDSTMTSLSEFVSRKIEQNTFGKVLDISSQFLIHKFQILRISVKIPASDPISFDTVGSLFREQRVSNSFSVAFHHEVAATLLEGDFSSLALGNGTKICISQAAEVKSEFADVLVYIARSDRGINTAIDATIRPILSLLKKEKSNQIKDTEKPGKLSLLLSLLVTSSTVASFRIEGLQVTCVPGGATRLTESPIIKFTLFRIAAGCCLVGQLVSPGVRLASSNSLDPISASSSKEYRHLHLGAWMSCEISAYYHNRRLVEWEPFIEPWCFIIRVGVDLMRIMKLPAVQLELEALPEAKGESGESSEPEQGLVNTVSRLADIGRLLRSPFGATQVNAGVMPKTGPEVTDTDACALLLLSKVSDMLESATLPELSDNPRFPYLPGSNTVDWMRLYGYPIDTDATSSMVDPALLCNVSDEGPLDINITGAMIDTLWQYLSKSHARETAPHLIQNRSGLTLRFQEVLDQDRSSAGERAPKVTLESGKFAPLSLRRSRSQSCDPHKAYIMVEFGAFDETLGRTGPTSTIPVKGTRSSVFTYRIAAKIAVDTVGVSRHPLEWVSERTGGSTTENPGNLGYVIVRVQLEGGAKIVSIESPLALSNTSDLNLFFEMREKDGISIVWNSTLKKSSPGASVPIPADLSVPLYTKACKLFVVALPDESDPQLPLATEGDFIEGLKIPPPFSQSSLARGVLSETDISVRFRGSMQSNSSNYFNSCSIRVGSISLDQQERNSRDEKESSIIPEQRMLLFRASVLFRNHLSLPMELEVRIVHAVKSLGLVTPAGTSGAEIDETSGWQHLGRLDCGSSLSWSGAAPWEHLQVRFRFVEEKGGPHRLFPSWSTPSDIPADGQVPRSNRSTRVKKSSTYSRNVLSGLTVHDVEDRSLLISLCLSQGILPTNKSPRQTMEEHLQNLHSSGRVVAFYAPFWIIDQSGLHLQFRSGTVIAGQEQSFADRPARSAIDETLGLGELLDNRSLSHLPSSIPFSVFMIGDRASSFINIRKGRNRIGATHESSWSTPVYLSNSSSSTRDTVVFASPGRFSSDVWSPDQNERESFVVCSRIIDAPVHYGGNYGTKFVHIVCKYLVVNDLGMDIEISSGPAKDENPLIVKADSRARPFSFISGRMRFRPKEYGWHWSGRFRISLARKDVTLRLRHGLKGYSVIVSVEFHPGETPGTSVIVFKKASHAPYRIENNSMYPIMFYQTNPFSQASKIQSSREQQDCVILPYHSASFAWDDPEDRWRSVGIQFADFGLLPANLSTEYIGSFNLDRLSPGTEMQLQGEGDLLAKIIAEGPTRVLRILGSSSVEQAGASPRKKPRQIEESRFPSVSAQIRLRNGIGISVVDWAPQELLYVDLQDILMETVVDKGKEKTNISVGYAAINNQLWVTPYPVAVSIGSRVTRRRHRRAKALSCSWSRSIAGDDSFESVTLLGMFEIATEPIDVRIDGRLATLVVDMARRAKAVFTRDKRLKHGEMDIERFANDFLSADESHPNMADELYASLDYMATNTIAAKLRHNYRPIHLAGKSGMNKLSNKPAPSFMKSKHKFYVEKIRVSLTSLTLSWHGFLPLSSRIRPAFFFEGLPIFMRPYVSSHVYGSVRDLVKGALSHYISVRRLLDVGVGAMIRKPLFFPREIFNYILTSFAGTLQVAERSLVAAAHANTESPWILPLTAYSAALLRGGVHILQAGSSIVRYGSITPRPTGAHLRSRNPRFFAHIDGNDLLVEYVEGENAGKALLSRVRMGANLIEGYSFHVEEVFESRSIGNTLTMDSKTLILMATNERLMLLQGQLDDNFCNVAWEVPYDDIANIECARLLDGYDHLTVWYLREFRDYSDSDDAAMRTVVLGSSGLAMLHPMGVFIPRPRTRQLLENLAKMSERFHHLLYS